MDNILIQRVNGNAISYKLHTGQTFYQIITDTSIYLQKVREHLVDARASNGDMPHCPFLKERLDRGGICNIYIAPFDQYISQLSLKSIDEVLTHNNEIASLLSGGIDDASVESSHGKSIYVSREGKNKTDGSISRFILLKPNICPVCNLAVSDMPLEDHGKSVYCRDIALNNMLWSKGLSRVMNDVEMQIIKAKNIPYEYHPISYGIYVPNWVHQAIKAYDSMKQRGGFVDMALSEYLTQMASTDDNN